MHWLLFISLLPKQQSTLAQAAKMNLWEINFEAIVLGKQSLIQTHLISSSFAFIFKPCDCRWKWQKVNATLISVCAPLERGMRAADAQHTQLQIVFFFHLLFFCVAIIGSCYLKLKGHLAKCI